MSKYTFTFFYIGMAILSSIYAYYKVPILFATVLVWLLSIIDPIGIEVRSKFSENSKTGETKTLTSLYLICNGRKNELTASHLYAVYTVIGWFLLCSIWLIIVLCYSYTPYSI